MSQQPTPRGDAPLRILQVLGNAVVGGVEQHALGLARDYLALGHAVACVAPFRSRLTTAFAALGVEVRYTPLLDDPPWRSIETLAMIMREQRIDVAHAHLPNAHTVCALAARLAGTPCVATIHGLSPSVQDIAVARLCDSHLIGVCEASYRQLLAVGLSPQRATLIRNGVDLDRFRPDAGERDRLRADIGAGPDDVLVAFVGRFSHEKGPDNFIRMAGAAHRALPSLRFLMAGGGPMEAELRALAGAAGLENALLMRGVARRSEDIYRAADILAHTSRSEAMPLVALEALACGCPVLGFGVGGVPEIVSDDETGVLTPPVEAAGTFCLHGGGWEAAASALVQLVSTSGKLPRMAVAARESALALFDARRTAAETCDVYRAMLAETARDRGDARSLRPIAMPPAKLAKTSADAV
jgi:glycosyltransferase involved in cell wall biosynthesis